MARLQSYEVWAMILGGKSSAPSPVFHLTLSAALEMSSAVMGGQALYPGTFGDLGGRGALPELGPDGLPLAHDAVREAPGLVVHLQLLRSLATSLSAQMDEALGCLHLSPGVCLAR